MADSNTVAAGGRPLDERLKRQSTLRKMLSRPELGAVAGTVLVFLFFAVTARGTGMFAADGVLNWITVTAQLTIIATGAALLMVGGEFDLSVGSMIGFAGMMIAIPTVYFGWPIAASVAFAFCGALAIGFLNGLVVVRTIVSGVKNFAGDSMVGPLFAGKAFPGLFVWLADAGMIGKLPNGQPAVQGIPAVVIWAFVIALIGHILLTRTRFGNWIFGAGGDANAARNVGVPVARVKILLFMGTAFCATVYATCQVMEFGSAAADRGLLKEFEAIIAAVIGGCLLTGGYGSVVGAFFGALIFGVVQMGILFTGAPNDWFQVFLGLMLLTAVLFNSYIRRRATGER
jgi:simple sugar transport system permease protein